MKNVTQTIVVLAFLFLAASGLQAQDVITFQVDMSVQLDAGYFNPDNEALRISGAHNGWWTFDAQQLTDANTDNIYDITLDVSGTDSPMNYKYIQVAFADSFVTWESIDNRLVDLTGGAQTLAPVFWNNWTDSTFHNDDITFELDMTIEIEAGNFNPAMEELQVSGSHNGWGAPSGDVLTDDDGDQIYSGTFDLTGSGGRIFYKHIQVDGGGGVGWENDPNREFELAGEPQTIAGDCWNDVCPGGPEPVTGEITFTVDTQVFQDLGLFTPAVANDTMEVRGSFNGWSGGENAEMQLAFGSFSVYEGTHTNFDIPGNSIFYKYFAKLDADAHDGLDGWEEPLSTGGGNREEIFAPTPQSTPLVYYMDITPSAVTTATSTVTMSVDMTAAINDPAAPFLPDQHNVYVGLYDQFFANMNGYDGVGPKEDLTLSSAGGNIYEITWDVAPSYAGVLYRFSYGPSADATVGEEGGGFGAGNKRARWIQPDGQGVPLTEYTFPMDVYNTAEDGLDIEPNPYLIVGINDGQYGVPNEFSLKQNYPNPFNPSTTIEYSVSNRVISSLAIYNTLGEKVRTIHSGVTNPGTHSFQWNGTNDFGQQVSSGVYIYKLSLGGEHTIARKMLLVK